MTWTCACCARILPDLAIENKAILDDIRVSVGSDCIKKIKEAGTDGYMHEKSGNGPLYSIAAWNEFDYPDEEPDGMAPTRSEYNANLRDSQLTAQKLK